MMTILEMLLALILLILAVSVFSALIMTVAGVLYQRNLDKKMPPQTVEATVVAKSQSDPPTHRRGAARAMAMRYSATFLMEDGDEVEMEVSFRQYDQLVEGAHGRLTYEGNRFQGFEPVQQA